MNLLIYWKTDYVSKVLHLKSLLAQPASLQVFVFQVFQLQHNCHHQLKGSDTGDLKFLRMHGQLTRLNHRSFYIYSNCIFIVFQSFFSVI